MATKQSPIQNIKNNLQQFGQEEKIARAKLKATPQSFNPEQGQALINATDAKVNQLENELVGVRGENIKQQIIALAKMQERGPLTADQQQELLSLLQEQKKLEIINLDQQYKQGLLDEAGQQQLIDLLRKQKQTPGTDYGSLEPKLIKADKAYAQDLSLIRPILDVNDEAGKKLQKKLIEKHYGPLGLAAHQNSSTGEWTAQYLNKQQHTLPGANLGEDIKRFGTSLVGGLLPNLIPGGKAVGTAARIAGAGGIEGFIKQRQEADAYNAAVEMGLLKPEEVKNISKKTTIPFVDMQIPESFTQGAIGGVLGQGIAGELLPAIPGAIKGVGKFAERVGTRGVAETAKKRAIQEAYLTEQLKNQATENPYNAATIIKNAIDRNVDNINITADSYFTKARQASETLTKDGQTAGKDFADITDWWNEFSTRFQDKPEVVKQMGDALGISKEIPGAPSQIIKEYGPAPITFKKYSDADLIEAGVIEDYYTREKLQFQKATLDERIAMAGAERIPELELKRDIAQKQISDISKKIDGALEGKAVAIETSPTEGFTITPQTIPGTGFVETLAKAKVGKPPVTSTKIAKTKPSTVFEPSEMVEGQVVGKISPFNYSQGYMTLNKVIDEAQMSDPLLYSQLVKAKVAYQKPLNIQIAKEELEKTTDFTKFAGQQTRMGYTDFKTAPKIPQGTAGAPYADVRRGFQTLEEGYNKIPTSLRNKVSGPVEIVNQKLFTSSGTPTFKQTEAKQINEAIVNNYGNTSPRILQEVSDSIVNQAIYRTKTTPTSTGIASSKITPELFEKASAITPQQQKALQARGVSLNIDKKAVEAAPGELIERINLGGRTGILNKSAEEKDVLSNLVGQENYEFSQEPLKNLLATQEASLEPVTTMGKLKGMFQQAGQANLATDVGVGGLIGAGIGGITPGISGFQGAGIGGLAGAAFRPAARATGSFIQQIPEAISRTPVLRELPSFVESPVGQMLGKGITAGTTASFVNPEEEQNILQQILRTRKFTNGNY